MRFSKTKIAVELVYPEKLTIQEVKKLISAKTELLVFRVFYSSTTHTATIRVAIAENAEENVVPVSRWLVDVLVKATNASGGTARFYQ